MSLYMNLYIPTLPNTDDRDGGKRKVLTTDFHFEINGVGYTIRKGFEWDGASIPWVLRWKYGTPFDGVHLVGGLVHDAIYANAVLEMGADRYGRKAVGLADFTRLEADNIYYAIIREYGAVMLRAAKEWLAVRFCGGSHWTER